jgi:hypothetical protein
MAKRKNTEEFIEDARKVHGDKYDYSLVEYINWETKVKVICGLCNNTFEISPNNHKNGRGCKKCGVKRRAEVLRMGIEEFIHRAEIIHGDKYDYSKVVFIDKFTEVKIICKTHGEINITPEVHLRTCGCKECGKTLKINNIKKDSLEQLQKIIDIHGDKYDYSKTVYTDSKTKIIATCRVHGDFSKYPHDFLSGAGCTVCGNSKKSQAKVLTTEQFIKKAEIIHNKSYDYSQTIYIKSNIEVEIKCKIDSHGIFKQKPNAHLFGYGCKKCSEQLISETHNGWKYKDWIRGSEKSKNFDSFKVYLIRCWNEEEEFYKIGKTFTTIHNRFPNKSVIPYNYEVITCLVFNDGRHASKKEEELKLASRSFKYVPKLKFSGRQECYNMNLSIKQIINSQCHSS